MSESFFSSSYGLVVRALRFFAWKHGSLPRVERRMENTVSRDAREVRVRQTATSRKENLQLLVTLSTSCTYILSRRVHVQMC